MFKDFDLISLVEPLADWFTANARTMPWRSNPLPYYVWVSEIMLQQTRVEAVRRYFDRFVGALPDVRALAECEEDVYLKLWEGLGYYSRVRNLHAAAVQIVEDYDGRIPDDYETLLKLKGIGHYTAGAIASLAYEKPVPAVDGNVLRVLTRVTADDTDIMKQSFRSEVEMQLRKVLEHFWTEAGVQVDSATEVESRSESVAGVSEPSEDVCISPRIINQALMELGALVCVPNGDPHCEECPWKERCLARKKGCIAQLPVKTKAKARRIEDKTVLLIRNGERMALHKRPPRGLLAGLYEFPNRPWHLSEDEVLAWIRSMGYTPLRIRRLTDATHIFSHVEWHMIGYSLLVEEEAFASEEQKERAAAEKLVFINAAELEAQYALPSAFAAYRDYVRF